MAWRTVRVRIVGVSPYVPGRFSPEAVESMHEAIEKSGKRRTQGPLPDPEVQARSRLYRTKDGRYGIPTAALRKAIIDAGRYTGHVMRKLAGTVDVEPQGYDEETGMPLVHINSTEPTIFVANVRLPNGSRDLRYRYYFPAGWSAEFDLLYDDTVLDVDDVKQLLSYAGSGVGIGEGRPLSPNSPGLGYGRFRVEEVKAA